MVREVKIDSLEELLPLLTEQEYREPLKRNRSSFIYRGMPDANYKMKTSLSRNCKGLEKRLEPAILENFAKYAVIGDPSIGQSVWRQMIEGQHNGLPTRLLDWSHSALVGLHFAMSEPDLEDMDKHDCCVWRIDMSEMVSILPEKYRRVVERQQATIFSVDALAEATGNSLSQYDLDMRDDSMVILEPPSINQQIVNQYSFFAVVPMEITDIEDFINRKTENSIKYIISKDIRWRIRDMLDQLNMSERIVYPGLQGLCKWIARHYYVIS